MGNVLTFDPTDAQMMRNPYDVFARLRETEPVHWCEPLQGWVVTGYDLCNRVVNEYEMFSADRMGNVGTRLPEPQRTTLTEVMRWLGLWMVFRDPPDHTRIRSHLRKVVSPPVMRRQVVAIEEITAQLLDTWPKGEAFDFYNDFGLTLPGYVTMDLLGVPRDRLLEVKEWSDEMMLFIGSSRHVENKYERARHGANSMAELFRELIAERRAEPRDDVLSDLLASTVDDTVLTEDELVASMMMIANGAQETTAHSMSNALIAMQAQPEIAEQFAALEDDKELQRATDEMLRYDGSVLSIARLVTTDIELAGAQCKAGDRIFAILIAANHDPETFKDPTEIDLGRRPNPHMTFSRGAHVCLGAPLARLETQIALNRILERHLGKIEFVEPLQDIPWVNSMVARGPARMPIRVG